VLKRCPTLIDACDKAEEIVSCGGEMCHLYRRAVRAYGKGELRTEVLSLGLDAIHDENLQDKIFINEEGMVSFFCGMWIQFLLTEIAGLKKDELRALAMKVFKDGHSRDALH
jgi:hypothetical protein